MATPALYRRYRPRRFAEIKGQDHVVRALRDAVAGGREGQAYLFSGPRGTGKTTSARVLAKVLNCERPVDGEPCCECPSCLDVERGVSYDVHELDAASNNGVEAMRELIEKAQLGTPGRHKVYILDEVHMLSKPAEAALLKTLEEPPDHVVFVLATTDPQKVSDTIRSRTQHLRFHLLPPDTLVGHVRWVAEDAGLGLTDEAIREAVAQGAGSARDSLSALELIASTGGSGGARLDLDPYLSALAAGDAGRLLTVMAGQVNDGHDPRTIADALVGRLRNAFLTLMAPDLVQLPAEEAERLGAIAADLGAARVVAAIERLGAILVDLRHAPDPRVLIEVALVQLASGRAPAAPAATSAGPGAAGDLGALGDRLTKLEAVVAGVKAEQETARSPVDPSTGRAKLGGRAQRRTDDSPTAPATPAAPAAPAAADGPPATAGDAAPPAPPVESVPTGSSTSTTSPAAASGGNPAADWNDVVRPGLRGLPRALFAPVEFVAFDAGVATLRAPNAVHQAKCVDHVAAVEQLWQTTAGQPVRVAWSDSDQPSAPGANPGHDAGGPSKPAPAVATDTPAAAAPTAAAAPPAETDRVGNGPAGLDTAAPTVDAAPTGSAGSDAGAAVPARAGTDGIDQLDEIDEIDESRPGRSAAESLLDRVAEAFPGAERIEDD